MAELRKTPAAPPFCPNVSVIIVSRGRPDALARALTGVAQMDYPAFEVVVVGDEMARNTVKNHVLGSHITFVAHDRPNLSIGRNLGLAQAAGEIVAFLDDDAVPEAVWLCHLIAPFAHKSVKAAGGYTRGPNGITLEFKGAIVGPDGRDRPLDHHGALTPVVHAGQVGQAIKTHGTNCAFDRSTLCEIGGFDPVFAYYLDEVDVNMRLSALGHATAMVPLAQVWHSAAPSAQRDGKRRPNTLFDVGNSSSLFWRKHAGGLPRLDSGGELLSDHLRRDWLRRITALCRAGLPQSAAQDLLRSLNAGLTAGRFADLHPLPRLTPTNRPFSPIQSRFSGQVRVVAGRKFQKRRLRAMARDLTARGVRVSLYLFSPDTRFHKSGFDSDGYWVQQGGLFGRSVRTAPLFQWFTFWNRVAKEVDRSSFARKRPSNCFPDGDDLNN